MLLQEKDTGNLVEILDVQALVNPVEDAIPGRDQSGQEEQEAEKYKKTALKFPSGEELPRCWIDANYRNAK